MHISSIDLIMHQTVDYQHRSRFQSNYSSNYEGEQKETERPQTIIVAARNAVPPRSGPHCSSVATGGSTIQGAHAHRACAPCISPPPSTGITTGFVQIRGDIFGSVMGEWQLSHRPPSWWGGGPLSCPPQKLHSRIGPSGHVTGVPLTLKFWLRHCGPR